MQGSKSSESEHEKKMTAPGIITFIIILYYLAVALICMLAPGILPAVKLLLAAISLALAGVALAMFWERICEIRSGEEDDLSQY